MRVAFAGLWTACDREGRFEWEPETLKLDCLPFDQVDFSRVLDALATRGHILKYEIDGRVYGAIPSWNDHQVINNRESPSVILPPPENPVITPLPTRGARVDGATVTPLYHAQAEGKGKEGERKGKGNGTDNPVCDDASAAQPKKIVVKKSESETAQTWDAYALAYSNRYGAEPVRNASVNGKLSQFVKRIGVDESPHVASFFVGHNNAWYVRGMHDVGAMLKDCEKLRTEWATNTRMTSTRAAQVDKTQTNFDAWAPLIAEAEERERMEKNGN